jgi:hypothetical protein
MGIINSTTRSHPVGYFYMKNSVVALLASVNKIIYGDEDVVVQWLLAVGICHWSLHHVGLVSYLHLCKYS